MQVRNLVIVGVLVLVAVGAGLWIGSRVAVPEPVLQTEYVGLEKEQELEARLAAIETSLQVLMRQWEDVDPEAEALLVEEAVARSLEGVLAELRVVTAWDPETWEPTAAGLAPEFQEEFFASIDSRLEQRLAAWNVEEMAAASVQQALAEQWAAMDVEQNIAAAVEAHLDAWLGDEQLLAQLETVVAEQLQALDVAGSIQREFAAWDLEAQMAAALDLDAVMQAQAEDLQTALTAMVEEQLLAWDATGQLLPAMQAAIAAEIAQLDLQSAVTAQVEAAVQEQFAAWNMDDVVRQQTGQLQTALAAEIAGLDLRAAVAEEVEATVAAQFAAWNLDDVVRQEHAQLQANLPSIVQEQLAAWEAEGQLAAMVQTAVAAELERLDLGAVVGARAEAAVDRRLTAWNLTDMLALQTKQLQVATETAVAELDVPAAVRAEVEQAVAAQFAAWNLTDILTGQTEQLQAATAAAVAELDLPAALRNQVQAAVTAQFAAWDLQQELRTALDLDAIVTPQLEAALAAIVDQRLAAWEAGDELAPVVQNAVRTELAALDLGDDVTAAVQTAVLAELGSWDLEAQMRTALDLEALVTPQLEAALARIVLQELQQWGAAEQLRATMQTVVAEELQALEMGAAVTPAVEQALRQELAAWDLEARLRTALDWEALLEQHVEQAVQRSVAQQLTAWDAGEHLREPLQAAVRAELDVWNIEERIHAIIPAQEPPVDVQELLGPVEERFAAAVRTVVRDEWERLGVDDRILTQVEQSIQQEVAMWPAPADVVPHDGPLVIDPELLTRDQEVIVLGETEVLSETAEHYVIRVLYGDTIWNLMRRLYGRVTLEGIDTILELNNLEAGRFMRAGSILLMPKQLD